MKEETRAEALEYADKALELAPKSPRTGEKDGNILDTVGWVYFLNGRVDDAKGFIERALRVIPNQPTITYHLGRIYEEIGDPRTAIYLYGKALGFNPNFAEADDAKIRAARNAAMLQEE